MFLPSVVQPIAHSLCFTVTLQPSDE